MEKRNKEKNKYLLFKKKKNLLWWWNANENNYQIRTHTQTTTYQNQMMKIDMAFLNDSGWFLIFFSFVCFKIICRDQNHSRYWKRLDFLLLLNNFNKSLIISKSICKKKKMLIKTKWHLFTDVFFWFQIFFQDITFNSFFQWFCSNKWSTEYKKHSKREKEMTAMILTTEKTNDFFFLLIKWLNLLFISSSSFKYIHCYQQA